MENFQRRLSKMKTFALVTLLAALGLASAAETFVKTATKLPYGLRDHSAVYDGSDAIYIIGGTGSGTFAAQQNVFKYSVQSGTVETVGQSKPIANGAALFDNGGIIYLGGNTGGELSSLIYRYDTNTNFLGGYNQLPVYLQEQSFAYNPATRIGWTFGGWASTGTVWTAMDGFGPANYSNHVYRYDVGNNYNVEITTMDARKSSASVFGNDTAIYIFGGTNGTTASARDVFQFDWAQQTFTKFPKQLPTAATSGCAVFNGRYAYLAADAALYRFDPITGIATKVTLTNWYTSLVDAACVHVPELKRMYVIGGYGKSNSTASATILDQITYVQL